MTDHAIRDSVEHLFRHESGRMLSVLVRLFGFKQIEVAEDIVQDTLLTAYEAWKLNGLPDAPRAWLYRTAKNKAVDFLRRERNFNENVAPNFVLKTARENLNANRWLDQFFLETEIEDAQLRMMFVCCHEALSPDYQLVLMLKTLCGLHTREIAAALLLPEDTIGKRLLRGREKLKNAAANTLEVPTGADLLPRLDAVLQAVYLLFSEGYKSSTNDGVIRRDLCSEALRLGDILARHAATDLPKTQALMALICFQASRFDARLAADGSIILLHEQDRSLWDQHLIWRGYQHLKAATMGRVITEYHLEAAIASYHASAATFEQTNWKSIFYCYDLLLKISPSPFVEMNRAIALGYAEGPQKGIDALLNMQDLHKNPHWHVALGDFYLKNNAADAAYAAYQKAHTLVQLPAERQVIERKMRDMNAEKP